jgi:hypothetical protein
MAEFSPFNLAKFKETIKNSNLRSKIASLATNDEDLFTMSLALSAAVKKIFFEKSDTKFSSEPSIVKKPIIQFMRRMRIDGLEKFDKVTFFSSVYYYKNAVAMDSQEPIGILIVYLERKYVPEMLRLLKYPYIDYDNDEEVLDGVGAIVNLIGGQFKRKLARMGYADVEMSPFESHVNTVVNGLAYPSAQTYKYEITFNIEQKKRLVIEMVMGTLPKTRPADREE